MSWLIQPLGPSLTLGIGALILLLLHSSPWRRWASGIALVAILTALVELITLRTSHAAILVGRPWASVLFSLKGGLIWRLDGWRWLGGIVVLLLLLAGYLLAWDARERLASYYRASDLALAAMALLSLFSGNLLTLASTWVLMESVALARLGLEPNHRPESGRAALSAASALLIALVCSLSGSALLTEPLSAASFTPLVQGVLVLAMGLRAAVYPFHAWLTHSRLPSLADRLSVYLIPATTSLWLLGPINSTAGIEWLGASHWTMFLLVSLLGSALAAWADPDRYRSLELVCANRATIVLLSMNLWPGQGVMPLAGWLLAFSLGTALLVTARIVHQTWGGRWPGVLAVLTLLGYPTTVGFLGQAQLGGLAPPAGSILSWSLITLADALLLAALLQGWEMPVGFSYRLSTKEARLLAATVLLAVPILLIGLRPGTMTSLSGIRGGASELPALLVGTPLMTWVRLLIVPMIVLWFRRGHRPAFNEWQGARLGMARIARLDWVYGLLQTLMQMLLAGWRTVLNIIEGEGYLGWVALAAVLIWLLASA